MTRPVLEFPGGQRPRIELAVGENVIGRGGFCAVRLDGDGVAERHARIIVNPNGSVAIQDLDSYGGTQRNGEFVYGQQPLTDGDEIRVGSMVLMFRILRTTSSTQVPKVTAPQPARTLIGVGPPPEIAAALAARQAAAPAPAPAPSTAANRVVGAPEPEPTNNRTVQMDSNAIEALLAASPQGSAPAKPATAAAAPAAPAAPQQPWSSMTVDDENTTIGAPSFEDVQRDDHATAAQRAADAASAMKSRDRSAFARTIPPTGSGEMPAVKPPVAAPAPSQPAGGATLFAPAPDLSKIAAPAAPPAPAPHPPAPSQPAGGATLFAPAPDLSKLAPPAAPPRAPSASQPVVPPPMAAPPPAPSAPPNPMVAPTPMPTGVATMQMQAPVLPVAQPQPQPQPQPYAQQPAPAPMAQPQGVPQPVGYAPTAPVAPLPPPVAAATPGAPFGGAAYTPPATKGSFGSISRAFAFMQQMMTLAFSNKALLKPIIWNLIITTPLNIGVGIAMGFVSSRGGFYGVLALGTALLYFTDYLCNAFTASLMFDYATTGEADMKRARARVMKALPGVMTFAAVSAILDVASTYARERNDIAAKILLRVLRAIWTTATYVIMPALVIEGVPFGMAFKRSKTLMDQDPTGVGAGIVAMYLVSTVVSIVCYALAYGALRIGVLIHPAVGGILFFTFVNLYWSVSGWFKIAYSTCFYMWARECERTGTTNQALAPIPLRAALDAA